MSAKPRSHNCGKAATDDHLSSRFTVVDFSPVDDSNQLSSRSVDSQFALVFLFINESTENF
jgi:hypothetical protein